MPRTPDGVQREYPLSSDTPLEMWLEHLEAVDGLIPDGRQPSLVVDEIGRTVLRYWMVAAPHV